MLNLGESNFAVGQDNMSRTCNVLMIGALALDYKEIDGLISFK